jgi:LysR family glycine cleavage system transcriptional activator
VRQLEESLGVRLFERGPRGVELTATGASLYPEISGAFDGIVSALNELPRGSSKSILKVTTTSSFASRWLVPRLGSWRDFQDGAIDVHLSPTLSLLDLVRDEADLAIRCGIPPWPGLTSHQLFPIHMTPVCSPRFLSSFGEMCRPTDLLNYTLLHADVGQNFIGTEWQTWFEAAGVPSHKRLPGLSFKDPALAWQAAINGLGFAIGYLELIEMDLVSQNLARPFDLVVQHPFSYYLVYSATRKPDPKITEFLKWITQEAKQGYQIGADQPA